MVEQPENAGEQFFERELVRNDNAGVFLMAERRQRDERRLLDWW